MITIDVDRNGLMCLSQKLIQRFEGGGSADYFVLEILIFHFRMIFEEISGSDHELTVVFLVMLFAIYGAS